MLQVRTRRAPASFQDFHLETPAAAGAAAAGSPDRAEPSLQGLSASDVQRRMLGLHHSQQQPGAAAGGSWELGGSSARGGQRQQLQPPPLPRALSFGRHHQQQQGLQRRGPQGSQQQQQGLGGALSEEFMQKFRATVEMVRSSGNVVGMEGAAALLADPEALKAFVSALSQHTDNPAAAMHRVAATLASQSSQQ